MSDSRGVQVVVNVRFEGGYAAPAVEPAGAALAGQQLPCRCNSRAGIGEADGMTCQCGSQAGAGGAAT